MPRRDGTGPMGNGPKTGWGAGYCTGDTAPSYVNPMPGRDFGRGSGRRRGWGHGRGLGRCGREGGFFMRPNPEEEQRFLEDHRNMLQSRLNDINSRLDELIAKEPKEK